MSNGNKHTDREKFLFTLQNALQMGGYAALVKSERERGFSLVRPGEVHWLPREDWPDNVVVSLDGKTVRIVGVHARSPGTGAFRRMISAIIAIGLSPVVIEPMFAMPAILAK